MLADAGVDVVSLANNHSLDYGPAAMAETITRLRAAGVEPVGAGANRAVALAPAERMVQGQRVAILAASQIIPTMAWVASDRHPGIASAGKHVLDDNTRRLAAAVRAARATHDVVIVVLHWGIEGSPCPSDIQRRWAAFLAPVGGHAGPRRPPPRVAADRPRRRRAGAGLTAYSAGNFIWDPRIGDSADTGVVEVAFDGARIAGTGSIRTG